MKHLRKLFTLVIIWLILCNTLSSVIAEWNPISIEWLEVQDNRNIYVTVDNEIETNSLSPSEIKLLHDIALSTSELDIANAKKAVVSLDFDLSTNTSYNLISITWVDWSIVFETWDNLNGEEIPNTLDDGIESITIIDPNNIEVYYYDAIDSSEIELKLLKDVSIESISRESDTEFRVKTSEFLKTESNYIFMLLAAKNIDNSEAEIENGIYNFDTPLQLEKASEEVISTPDLNAASEIQDSTPIMPDDSEEQSESKTELKNQEMSEWSNKEEDYIQDDWSDQNTASGSNIEVVASEATTVPEAGPATHILMILTLLCALWIHFKMKKR